MATAPFAARATTATQLTTLLNAALAPLTSSIISNFEAGMINNMPTYGKNLFAAFGYSSGGVTLAAPFVALHFSATTEADVLTLMNAFVAANPTYFFVMPWMTFRQFDPNPNGVVIGILVYNTVGAAAAANWAGGGGGVIPPTPNGYTPIADANYQILASDFEVELTSISAARTFTLPARSSVRAGQEFVIGDSSGNLTSTLTLTVVPSGTDTLNGALPANRFAPLQLPYQQVRVIAAGTGAWLIDEGFNVQMPGRTAVSNASYAATPGDFLISYTSLLATRVVTLPQAASVPPGKEIIIADSNNQATSTIQITVSPFAGDTINGGAVSPNINYAGGIKRFVRSSPTNWMVQDARDVQIFTSSGTWVKPPACSAVIIQLVGGGSGGGGGGQQVATSGGGGGGSAGCMSRTEFPASSLPATAAVAVGAGGTGGAGGATATSTGVTGGDGGTTSFGTVGSNGLYILTANGAIGFGGGVGGSGAAGTGGGVGQGGLTGGAGGAGGTSANGVVGGAGGGAGGGGGGGAGISAATAHNGGNGGRPAQEAGGASGVSAVGGAAGGTNPGGTGPSVLVVSVVGGGGGGGGGSFVTGVGGRGGDGGLYGGGGGGGAGALNGNAGGRGGDGANGIAIIISW